MGLVRYKPRSIALSAKTGGRIGWRWRVGRNTKPGIWPVVVSCGKYGTLRMHITIVAESVPLRDAAKAVCARAPARVMARYATQLTPMTQQAGVRGYGLGPMVAEYGEFDCAFQSSFPNSMYIVSVKRGTDPCTFSATARVIWINLAAPSGYTGPVNETYSEDCKSLGLRANRRVSTYLYKGEATRLVPTVREFAADAGRFWGQAGGPLPRITSRSGGALLATVRYEYPPTPHWRSDGISTLTVTIFPTEAEARASFARACAGCSPSSHGYKVRRPSAAYGAPTVFLLGACRNLMVQMTWTALYPSTVIAAPLLAVADGIFTKAERLGMAGCF